MFTKDLQDLVFKRHDGNGAEELLIITGYIGPSPFRELSKLPIKCRVIYGMYGSDSIGERLHKTLNEFQSSSQNTELHYSKAGIHAKCYLWTKEGVVIDALVGSANFSHNGLATPNREVLVEADPEVFPQLNEYFKNILSNSITCDSHLVVIKTKQNQNISASASASTECKLSFLSKIDGVIMVPKASGINWGANSKKAGGTSNTSIGDAEIRITKEAIKAFPRLFPPKIGTSSKKSTTGKLTRQNDEIELIWDDGFVMKGLLEQNNSMNGLLYPKAICSSEKKSVLGLYLRKRLGVSPTHIITKEDLTNYGRTDVTVSLLAEGVYEMDFSVNKTL